MRQSRWARAGAALLLCVAVPVLARCQTRARISVDSSVEGGIGASISGHPAGADGGPVEQWCSFIHGPVSSTEAGDAGVFTCTAPEFCGNISGHGACCSPATHGVDGCVQWK